MLYSVHCTCTVRDFIGKKNSPHSKPHLLVVGTLKKRLSSETIFTAMEISFRPVKQKTHHDHIVDYRRINIKIVRFFSISVTTHSFFMKFRKCIFLSCEFFYENKEKNNHKNIITYNYSTTLKSA